MPIVVFISGEGTNLKAILDNCINVKVVAVVTDNYDSPILLDLPKDIMIFIFSETVNDMFVTLPEYPEMIVLAGFMRILSKEFIDKVGMTILNIHPSLLPKYKGLNTHQRSYDAGDDEHGCSVHIVTPELDSGLILAQRQFNAKFLTVEERKNTCKHMEHFLYPTVIDTCAGIVHYIED